MKQASIAQPDHLIIWNGEASEDVSKRPASFQTSTMDFRDTLCLIALE